MSQKKKHELLNLSEQILEFINESDSSVLTKIDALAIVTGKMLCQIRKEARKAVVDGTISTIKKIASL